MAKKKDIFERFSGNLTPQFDCSCEWTIRIAAGLEIGSAVRGKPGKVVKVKCPGPKTPYKIFAYVDYDNHRVNFIKIQC